MGVPVGLDFGAIFTVAGAMGADATLLVDVLPDIEPMIIDNICGHEPDATE